jgi:hypothetical protein
VVVGQGFDEFVAQYAKPYEAYDREGITEFIFCPCRFLRQDTLVLLDTPAKILDFLEMGLRSYRDAGCAKFIARLLESRRLSARFGLVDIGWTMTRADGTTAMEFRTTYNVIDDRGRWRIYAITRHD